MMPFYDLSAKQGQILVVRKPPQLRDPGNSVFPFSTRGQNRGIDVFVLEKGENSLLLKTTQPNDKTLKNSKKTFCVCHREKRKIINAEKMEFSF